ncbi:MAG: purine-nucleoside phosphorylase [Chloroflexi bacterium]|nr:purine-nucleoside phosphorylase [Chloroflexota bacterium]
MTNKPLSPHISASPQDFASTVLMPGDPLRSKMIAEKFLTNAKLVNNVRGVQGYTGSYLGKRVSVMGSGMGMPSIGIYSFELFNFSEVSSIIRVGSAGAIDPDLELFDIVLGQGACTDSNYFNSFGIHGSFAPIADYGLLSQAVAQCESRNYRYRVGNLLSSDVFYQAGGVEVTLKWREVGVLAVEMEAAALYMNAAAAGKKALAICTISDLLEQKKEISSQERETSFLQMIEVAMNIAED